MMKRDLRCGSRRRRQAGFVLIVVLILLTVMTAAVVYAVRRATTDERIAGAMRDGAAMQAAADASLRYCELWLWVRPPGSPTSTTLPDPPKVVTAPLSNAAEPAWRAKDWTTDGVTLPADFVRANMTARCLIEDASAELSSGGGGPGGWFYQPGSGRGAESKVDAAGNLVTNDDARFVKYRITAQVSYQPNGTGLTRIARAQTEIRLFRGS